VSAGVTLVAVSPAVRHRCVALEVGEGQRRFVAPVEDYLAMSDWTPLAVCRDGEVVGFVMWAVDPDEGSHWIGGLLVDRAHQGRGIGRAAMERLIASLPAREVALSYEPDNVAARRLYASLGFRETGERTDDGELVARLTPAQAGGSALPADAGAGAPAASSATASTSRSASSRSL
jgi:diamine N-acetyltransferase